MDKHIILTPTEAKKLETFFYHKVDENLSAKMEMIRVQTIRLALSILRSSLPTHSQSCILTQLEELKMCTSQALSSQGEMIIPNGIDIRTA